MAVEKFFQIPISASAPLNTDFLVGVTAGGVDQRFTAGQVGALKLVSLDPRFDGFELVLYVATTGNDSNAGTLASPYLTIQRAINEAVRFSYENQYSLIINVAAGTYTIVQPILCTELFYLGAQGLGSISGAGIGSTIISAQGFASFQPALHCQSTTMANWNLFGITFDTNFYGVICFGPADMFVNQCEFKDTSGGGNLVPFFSNIFGIIEVETITVSATTFRAYAMARGFGNILCIGSLTLPATSTVSLGFLSAVETAWINFGHSSVTNSGGLTGPRFNLAEHSTVFSANGLTSDIPGSTAGYVDTTSAITTHTNAFPFQNSTKASFFGQQSVNLPTSSDISSGCWTVVKQVGSGPVTWDPATTSAGIVLSGGNLVASNPASGAANEFAYSNVTGTKVYFEVVCNTDAGGGNAVGIGVADSGFTGSSYLGSDIHSGSQYDGGTFIYNTSSITTTTTFTSGDNVSVAVDAPNKLIWTRTNGGNWNGSPTANPATATGGISLASIGSPIKAAVDLRVTQGSTVTAQFDSGSFTYVAPAGFSALVSVPAGGVYVLYNDAGTIKKVALV